MLSTPEITILLSEQTSLEEKTLAANNIINNYNLDLETNEILLVMDGARKNITFFGHDRSNFYIRYEYLFNYLLTKNIEMFMALVKAKNYDNGIVKVHKVSILINSEPPFKVGNDSCNVPRFIIGYYQILLNYNDFNIDDLALTEMTKNQIQEYRDEKYGGKLTKVAN